MTQETNHPIFSKVKWFAGGFIVAILATILVVLLLGSILREKEERSFLQASDPYHLLATCEEPAPKEMPTAPWTLTDQIVITWAEDVVPQLLSFDHTNVKEMLLEQKKHFTPKGWCSFVHALAEAHLFEAIQTRQLSINLTKQGPSSLTKKSGPNEPQWWQTETPAMMTYTLPKPNAPPSRDETTGTVVLRIENFNEKPAIAQYILMPKQGT